MLQEILLGPERRRRWSQDQKIAIVLEAGKFGVKLSDVARRHGITRQQIYRWRSDIRRSDFGVGGKVDHQGSFLAVELVGGPNTDSHIDANRFVAGKTLADVVIKITLQKGRVLQVPASIAPDILTLFIRATEAA